MREQMLLLKDLQETESLIGKLEKEHEEVLTSDEARKILEAEHTLQKNMGNLEKDREKFSMQYKREELLLMSVQTEKQQVEKSLYSGTVRNNKEMTQIQGKIQQLQDRLEKQENCMMGIMETQETLERKIADHSERLMQMQSELKMKRRENTEHILRLTTQVKELMLVKNNLQERIPQDLLTIYGELKRKKGKAVAWLQGDICTGCRVAVPSHLISEIQEAGRLKYCETCGRLLIPHEQ